MEVGYILIGIGVIGLVLLLGTILQLHKAEEARQNRLLAEEKDKLSRMPMFRKDGEYIRYCSSCNQKYVRANRVGSNWISIGPCDNIFCMCHKMDQKLVG